MIDVDTTRAPAFLRYTWPDGQLSADEFLEVRDQLKAQGLLTGQTRSLVDARTLAALPTFAEIQNAVARATRTQTLPAAMAFLVTPGVQYGVARQVSALLPHGMRGEVFTAEADAWRWLEGLDARTGQ